MPEGDTIHKIANYLAPKLKGRRIGRGRAPRHPEVSLAGRRVRDVHAHGKHLFIDLDDGHTLRTHLGMHGSWHRYALDEAWRKPEHWASVVFDVGDDVYVCFNAREVEWLRTDSVHRRIVGTRLGPDLVDTSAETDQIVRRARELHEGDACLADVLLDQRVAAGIGNVYKSELLFMFRQHPDTELQTVPDATLREIFTEAGRLLRRNLGGGRRVTRHGDESTARLWVYRREGEPCLRCGTPIKRRKVGWTQRSTYHCPHCQPAP